MLLLIDTRREPEPSRPDRLSMPWRVVPSFATTIACLTVGMTTDGAVGALATIGAFAASCRALDRALPYAHGLREHRQ